MELRPYQSEAEQDCLNYLSNPNLHQPTLILQPTGAGKSLIIGSVASNIKERSLILQPSGELLVQNLKKYIAFGGCAGVYAASLKAKQRAKTTFALLGSIVTKPHLFEDVKVIIMDEAHLYPPQADSMFRKFISQINPEVKIIGFTASPFRLTSINRQSKLIMLDQCENAFFKSYTHITQISDIAKDWWSPLEYIEKGFDFEGLKVNAQGSDYTEESLAAAGTFIEGRIIEAVTKLRYNKAIVFVSTIEQAARLAELVPNAASVSGKTPDKERSKIITDYLKGKIKVIFNVNVLAVGFDSPATDCVICARPTMSGAMFYQQVGRATRPHETKTVSLVVDLAGNLDKFGRVEDFIFKKSFGGHYELFSGKTQITGRSLDNISISRTSAIQMDKAVQDQPKPTKVRIGGFNDMVVTFGTHKDKPISKIPRSWLHWAVQNLNKPILVRNIKLFLSIK